jgi:hypothetical protein
MAIQTPLLIVSILICLAGGAAGHWVVSQTSPAIDPGTTARITDWLEASNAEDSDFAYSVGRVALASDKLALSQQDVIRVGSNALLIVGTLLSVGALLARRRAV